MSEASRWTLVPVRGSHPGGDDHGCKVVDEAGKAVAWFDDDAPAEQIVREHNAHAGLVEACQRALVTRACDKATRDMLREAVAAATGKPVSYQHANGRGK